MRTPWLVLCLLLGGMLAGCRAAAVTQPPYPKQLADQLAVAGALWNSLEERDELLSEAEFEEFSGQLDGAEQWLAMHRPGPELAEVEPLAGSFFKVVREHLVAERKLAEILEPLLEFKEREPAEFQARCEAKLPEFQALIAGAEKREAEFDRLYAGLVKGGIPPFIAGRSVTGQE